MTTGVRTSCPGGVRRKESRKIDSQNSYNRQEQSTYQTQMYKISAFKEFLGLDELRKATAGFDCEIEIATESHLTQKPGSPKYKDFLQIYQTNVKIFQPKEIPSSEVSPELLQSLIEFGFSIDENTYNMQSQRFLISPAREESLVTEENDILVVKCICEPAKYKTRMVKIPMTDRIILRFQENLDIN